MYVQKAKDTQFIQEKGKYDFQKILRYVSVKEYS